jgi:hypothetical protein
MSLPLLSGLLKYALKPFERHIRFVDSWASALNAMTAQCLSDHATRTDVEETHSAERWARSRSIRPCVFASWPRRRRKQACLRSHQLCIPGRPRCAIRWSKSATV